MKSLEPDIIVPLGAVGTRCQPSRAGDLGLGSFWHEKCVVVGPATGGVDIEHFQPVWSGGKRMGGAGWEPEKCADFQLEFFAIEPGFTSSSSNKVELFGAGVVTSGCYCSGLNLDAPGSGGTLLFAQDKRPKLVRPQS